MPNCAQQPIRKGLNSFLMIDDMSTKVTKNSCAHLVYMQVRSCTVCVLIGSSTATAKASNLTE